MRFPTKKSFAEALGVSRNTLGAYLQREDCPVSDSPPWTGADVKTLNTWRGDELRGNRASGRGQWHKQLVMEQTKITRLKRELLEGKYIEHSIHERSLLSLVDVFIGSLDAIGAAIPLAIEGLDPAEAKTIIHQRFAEAISNVRDTAAQQQAITQAQAKDTLPRAGKGRPARGAQASSSPRRRRSKTKLAK